GGRALLAVDLGDDAGRAVVDLLDQVLRLRAERAGHQDEQQRDEEDDQLALLVQLLVLLPVEDDADAEDCGQDEDGQAEDGLGYEAGEAVDDAAPDATGQSATADEEVDGDP